MTKRRSVPALTAGALNVGVGVFVDRERSACMVDEHRTKPVRNPRLCDCPLHLMRHFGRTAAARLDGEDVRLRGHEADTFIHIAA